jgi:hypothetical protein
MNPAHAYVTCGIGPHVIGCCRQIPAMHESRPRLHNTSAGWRTLFFSSGQRRALEYEGMDLILLHSGDTMNAIAQHLLGMRVAFATAGSDAQLVAQLGHRRRSRFHHLADRAIGNVLANADNHY